jgi:anthranilate synthase component 1
MRGKCPSNTHSPIPSDSAAPTVRSFSAEFEPLRLIERYPDSYPGLLESSAPGGTTSGCRFDILPMSSGEALVLGSDGRLSGPHANGNGFLGALQEWWSALHTPSSTMPLPFTGGWLLYLSYELAAEIEPQLNLPSSADSVRALAIRTPAAWIRDRVSGEAWLIAEPDHAGLLDLFEEHVSGSPREPFRDALRAPQLVAHVPTNDMLRAIVHEEDPTRFLAGVAHTLDYIAAGDVYQVNLSRQWRVESAAPDPVALYERLRSTNPSPFAALLRYQGFSIMSSSPERLLSIRDGIVSTRPIAGTRPRGVNAESDAALIDSLLNNEKERAEHVMLIDLERNDLGRVCAAGSVRVDEYMTVETYAHVHHIVSNVSGRLTVGVSPIAAIRALFPGGTITGCPKVRCMEIIAELEGSGRGAYTGSVGYLNRDGSCDLNILIRTLTADRSPHGHTLNFRAGAGIVADSNPEQELAETRAKALGMLRAVETST